VINGQDDPKHASLTRDDALEQLATSLAANQNAPRDAEKAVVRAPELSN
jgi:hypothetical protein